MEVLTVGINFTSNMEKGMEYLHKRGAFLTVKDNNIVNTMTISWGNIGFEWNRPIFTVLVRKSRYTHELLENCNEFTISIPTNDELKRALALCGTKSGRDTNKFDECNLSLDDSKELTTPVIGNCQVYYECKVVYKQDMDLNLLKDDIKSSSYKDGDYHTIYYGEIVSCYSK